MRNQRTNINGWKKPPNAIKAHYFHRGKTLCGGQFYSYNGYSQSFTDADKCSTCAKKAVRYEQ